VARSLRIRQKIANARENAVLALSTNRTEGIVSVQIGGTVRLAAGEG
jgi:hypothetical protein